MSNNLKLDGTCNTRSLNNSNENCLLNNVYRSDSLDRITEKDICILKDLQILTQIDLRSEDEILKRPSKLKDLPGFNYIKIPMLDEMNSLDFTCLTSTLEEIYCKLLETERMKFIKIIELIQDNHGNCIFSCTLGKDRTGITAMLLQLLAGIDHESIIRSYSESELNIVQLKNDIINNSEKRGIYIPEAFLLSPESVMENTLNTFHQKYKSIGSYLNVI